MTETAVQEITKTQKQILFEIKQIKANLSRFYEYEDEKVWEAMEPVMRKTRAEIFRKTYPNLYAKTRKRGK